MSLVITSLCKALNDSDVTGEAIRTLDAKLIDMGGRYRTDEDTRAIRESILTLMIKFSSDNTKLKLLMDGLAYVNSGFYVFAIGPVAGVLNMYRYEMNNFNQFQK